MPTRTITIELRGEQRDDGCYHLKSAEFPGFHFIIGPEEEEADFKDALNSALMTFAPRFFAAKAREQRAATGLKITRSRSQMNFTAELELA
jgi:hypothetical protein